MVLNATFNNSSVISWQSVWQSVLLVEETGVPAENHHPDVHFVHNIARWLRQCKSADKYPVFRKEMVRKLCQWP
jgi:hypothetical protein